MRGPKYSIEQKSTDRVLTELTNVSRTSHQCHFWFGIGVCSVIRFVGLPNTGYGSAVMLVFAILLALWCLYQMLHHRGHLRSITAELRRRVRYEIKVEKSGGEVSSHMRSFLDADPRAEPDDRSPAKHCFREDSPTSACRTCGEPPEAHTGCDCEEPT